MKKLLLVLACIFLVTGCGNVKLANGENELVSLEGVDNISSEDLYKELKKSSGVNKLITLVDTKILNKLYETTDEETAYVKDAVKSAKKSAEDMNADFKAYIQYYYGAVDEDNLKEILSLDFKRDKWKEDYSKEAVTEKQLKDYYNDYYFGDIEAKHILITIDAKSDASSEEKTEAENKARERALEVINKLKAGEKFEDLVKQYSKDSATSSKEGNLGKINRGDYDDDVLEALNKLKVGAYSDTPVKSSYGYHVLYKVSQDDKKELKDVEDKLRTIIGKELQEENNFSAKALKVLREKYKIDIKDNELKKEYDDLMAQYQ